MVNQTLCLLSTIVCLIFGITSANAEETLIFSDLLLAANPDMSTEQIPASELSNSFVQLSGSAFMQNVDAGQAAFGLHMGTQIRLHETSDFESSSIRMDFSTPIETARLAVTAHPDWADSFEALQMDQTLKILTPPSASIELFDLEGRSVGFYSEALDIPLLSGTSPFSSLVFNYTDGLGTIEFHNNQCSFDPDCERFITEVALTGHIIDMVYQPIPEPSTYLLLLIGAGSLLVINRRNRFGTQRLQTSY